MDKRALIFVLGVSATLFFVNKWFFQDEKKPTVAPPAAAIVVESAAQPYAAREFAPPPLALGKEEQFYVIENEYQQLVFSSVGGALAEINLKLYDKENPQLPIRPIHFDKVMAKEFPGNDRFPSSAYQIHEGNSIQTKQGQAGGFYPLLRRTLYSSKGDVIKKSSPQHYALNVIDEASPGVEQVYRLKRLEKNLIEWESEQANRKITKTFSFPKNSADAPYCVDVAIRVEGDARNLWLTSGIPEVELISGDPSPSLKYLTTKSNQKRHVEQLSLPKAGTSTTMTSIYPNWIGNSNGFLGLIIDPLSEIGAGFKANQIPGAQNPSRITLVDAQHQRYPIEKFPGYEMMLPLKAQAMQFRVFAGPFEDDILKKIDRVYTDPSTGHVPSFVSAISFHGWFSFISEPFAKFLFALMHLFYKATSSWGISIILLTLALRIMLYPLNAWSIKSSIKMQQIAPQVAALQEKYKKDPKRAQLEIMSLYREKGANPFTGCFPLLIQLPFLIGMFDLLKSTFGLRGATFIPGWIDNLTAPDILFSWSYPIFFFGTDFHLLPFLLGAIMWIQQRFSSPSAKDPKALTDQQKQQRMMGNIMTVVFTVMFYNFPSGLNIYWLSSMALGILQQWWMARKMNAKPLLQKGDIIIK
ncbi:MAG TPA: membrane protein insertase YidC [Rhabdochlamydiaceae bacterium]|jgi:YidC/Oxa1 family membrane protein insertase